MICKNQVVGKDKNGMMFIHPCGQCLSCRINDTRSWFVRSWFEVKYSDRPYHYFITLTYDPEFLPKDNLCQKTELKKFLNNFNTTYGLRLRYFATSDYGSVNNRAHYHAIILTDKPVTSKQISKIWKKGFCSCKPLTPYRIKYCLRYTVKKKPFDGSLEGWFRLISKKWGASFVEHYTGQKDLILDGVTYSIPMYYYPKIGLEKKTVDKSQYFDRLYLEHRDVLGTDYKLYEDLKKQFFERRKFKNEHIR